MADPAYHFICGDDDFLIHREGQVVFGEMTRGLEDDLSREVINGMAQNLDEAEKIIERFRSAVMTLSMFGGRKAVWLKGLNLLADTVTGRSEGARERMEQLLEILPTLDPSQVSVLITAFPVDRRRREFKAFAKGTGFKDLKGGSDEKALVSLVNAEAGKLGVAFAPGAARMLIGRVSGNTRLLLLEVDKLATYLDGRGTVSESLVLDLVPEYGESDFFEVTEAFFSLNTAWALEANRRYFFTRNTIRPLLASMQNRNRLLIQLKVLIDAGQIRLGSQGFSKDQLAKAAAVHARHFDGLEDKSAFNVFSQNAWYLGNRLAPEANKMSLKRLVDFQLEFKRAFVDSLNRHDNPEAVMRDLIIRCLN